MEIELINNLRAIKTVIDHQEQRLTVHCLDSEKFDKSYYLNFEELESSLIEEQIKQVIQKGKKWN